MGKIIRIHREAGIEKSVPRIAFWYHEACQVMINGDPEGRIFLSYPHTNNGLFFLLTIDFFVYFKLSLQKSLNTLRFHMITLLDVLGNIAWVDKIIYPRVKSQIFYPGCKKALSVCCATSLRFSFNFIISAF